MNIFRIFKKEGIEYSNIKLIVRSIVVISNRNRFSKTLDFGCNIKIVLRFTRYYRIIRKDRELLFY